MRDSKTNADQQPSCEDLAEGPLAGVKIVEMSAVVFGPYGGQILADLGAEVIKVEDESGDVMRHPGNSPAEGLGPIFLALNRNKKSLQLNLKRPSAKEAMLRLLETADVFYTNVRLEGLQRLGLGYADVQKVNPNILYVHCSGFSSQGPYAGRAAYDDLVQAASGFADLLPRSDGHSQPKYMPSLIADKTAGLHAAYATMAGLFYRQRTGLGQFVEVPMFEAFTSFNMVENLYEHTYEPATGDVAYTRSIDANRKPYKTRDGYISIMPYSANDWQSIMKVVGVEDVLNDPKFSTYQGRAKNISELYSLLHASTSSKSTDEWREILTELEIPHTKVNRLDEVKQDEHLRATDFFELRQHTEVGPYYSVRPPVRFSRTPASVRSDPPSLGAHSDSVLFDLGYSQREIDLVLGRVGE